MMQEIPNEIKPGDQVTAKAEFIMLNRDDQKWLPLFTSLPELQKWSTGPSCPGSSHDAPPTTAQ